jgi:hypothetical protein
MNFEINPLNVFNERFVDSTPIHFVKTKLSGSELIETELIDWIDAKLKGRYSLSYEPEIDSQGKLRLSTFVGFEDQKELTYFILACPHLRRF